METFVLVYFRQDALRAGAGARQTPAVSFWVHHVRLRGPPVGSALVLDPDDLVMMCRLPESDVHRYYGADDRSDCRLSPWRVWPRITNKEKNKDTVVTKDLQQAGPAAADARSRANLVRGKARSTTTAVPAVLTLENIYLVKKT